MNFMEKFMTDEKKGIDFGGVSEFNERVRDEIKRRDLTSVETALCRIINEQYPKLKETTDKILNKVRDDAVTEFKASIINNKKNAVNEITNDLKKYTEQRVSEVDRDIEKLGNLIENSYNGFNIKVEGCLRTLEEKNTDFNIRVKANLIEQEAILDSLGEKNSEISRYMDLLVNEIKQMSGKTEKEILNLKELKGTDLDKLDFLEEHLNNTEVDFYLILNTLRSLKLEKKDKDSDNKEKEIRQLLQSSFYYFKNDKSKIDIFKEKIQQVKLFMETGIELDKNDREVKLQHEKEQIKKEKEILCDELNKKEKLMSELKQSFNNKLNEYEEKINKLKSNVEDKKSNIKILEDSNEQYLKQISVLEEINKKKYNEIEELKKENIEEKNENKQKGNPKEEEEVKNIGDIE